MVVVQLLSHVLLYVTLWTARQAPVLHNLLEFVDSMNH